MEKWGGMRKKVGSSEEGGVIVGRMGVNRAMRVEEGG